MRRRRRDQSALACLRCGAALDRGDQPDVLGAPPDEAGEGVAMSNETANQGAAAPHSLTLVIDRARWLRGMGAEASSLLLEGEMCCLGFFALVCGMQAGDIRERGGPINVRPEARRWPAWLMKDAADRNSEPSSDGYRLMELNDNEMISEEYREEQLINEFAKHGVAVEFVGDAAPAAPKEPQP